MEHWIAATERLGNCLWLSDGKTELAASLEYGLRLVHLSCRGMENLFFEENGPQPGLSTPEGWSVHAGQRLWLAPESNWDYYPDNDPISYELLEDGVVLRQHEDPRLHAKKSACVRFLPDGGIRTEYTIVNTADAPLTCALWVIRATAPGGQVRVPFDCESGTDELDFKPGRSVMLWSSTSLGDERLQFSADSLTATQKPRDEYLKLGFFGRKGLAVLENRGQRLTIHHPAERGAVYADGGCNFELFLCRQMMEVETLSPLVTLQPGESATHGETWYVERI
jgi:hypothetical protein